MNKKWIAVEKINSLTAILYLIGLGILVGFDFPDLWGGLLILTGFCWIVRQFLLGRFVDVLFILLIFGGSWLSHYFIFYPYWIIPALLALGTIYIVVDQIYSFWRRRSGSSDTSTH